MKCAEKRLFCDLLGIRCTGDKPSKFPRQRSTGQIFELDEQKAMLDCSSAAESVASPRRQIVRMLSIRGNCSHLWRQIHRSPRTHNIAVIKTLQASHRIPSTTCTRHYRNLVFLACFHHSRAGHVSANHRHLSGVLSKCKNSNLPSHAKALVV
nr:hypothetical protein CFP56_30666 [Quercus suber]